MRLIGGIEGCRRCHGGDAKESDGERRSFRENDGHPIAAADAHGGKARLHALELAEELGIAEWRLILREERDLVRPLRRRLAHKLLDGKVLAKHQDATDRPARLFCGMPRSTALFGAG